MGRSITILSNNAVTFTDLHSAVFTHSNTKVDTSMIGTHVTPLTIKNTTITETSVMVLKSAVMIMGVAINWAMILLTARHLVHTSGPS
jgi:hypothetical protein